MLMIIVNEVCQKVGEAAANLGLDCFNSVKDFDHNLELLQVKLGSLSIKAADVDKELENLELSRTKKRKGEVDQWLAEVESIKVKVDELKKQAESEGCIVRFCKGGEAARLNEQVEKLLQQPSGFGELVLDARGTTEEILLTNGMVGKAFQINLKTILKVLEDRQVSKIDVYGMGGVGKTTLAKHIYNRLVQQSQGSVFWITVSQEFTINSLQEKIAHCLGKDFSDKDEEAIRAGKLNSFLLGMKNPVLILDDVWERIDMSKVGCTFSVEGCRLIITTRSLEVCHQIGCKKLISVVKLCKDEAWKLFNETLENEVELGPQVEEIAKFMTMMCGGLPLGIITLAGSMKGETAIHTWRNALAELKECVGGQDGTREVEEVFKVLKYSFDRLKRNGELGSNDPNMIQQCFLYCSLYPEDYEIVRGDLVRRYISDGLVDGKRSRRAQVEQGLSILDKLVNLCLLESCVNYDKLECVKMHDLVRSMALRICKGKYLVRAGKYMVRVGERSLNELPNIEEWTKDLEKVSLMECDMRRIGEGFSPDCPKLSTLLLRRNFWLEVIPESFFSKIQGLCTLDLGGNSHITKLPDSISDLTCLRSLHLEYCDKLEKVPYLGKMKAMRELNLSGTGIKEAPQGLEELLNLRFLSLNAPGLKMLPRGVLLKLVHLQHLNLPLDVQVEIEEMENLKRPEEFHGGVKSISDFNKFVKSRASDRCYRIRVSQMYDGAVRLEMGWANNNELVLHNCDLKDEKLLVKGFMDLRICKCEGVSKWLELQFDNPTYLKKLEIRSCEGIEWIMMSGDGQLSSTLEEIDLRYLDDLKGVVERERGGIGLVVVVAAAKPPVFSSLKSLLIYHCKKMRKLGLPVSALPNLEQIEIMWCEEVEEIFEEEDEGRDSATTLPILRKLKLYDLPRLRKVGLPAASRFPNLELILIEFCGEIQEIFEDEDEGRAADSIVTTLPKLRALELKDLPRLKRVSKATIISNSIRSIMIRKCPEIMKKWPLDFDGPAPPTSLRYIRVDREWWESLERDDPNLPSFISNTSED